MVNGKKVLLVGDCGGMIQSSEGPLQRAELVVRTASSGREALTAHRIYEADLIVTDLDLPDMTAEHLCQLIREDGHLRKVSLLVVCGADEGERQRAADCRANSHVVRPVDGEALAVQITRLLAIRHRAAFRVLARITVGGIDNVRSFFCTSENLSASGILIETEELLSVGESLECGFFLPGAVRVMAAGRVVRTAELGMIRQYGIEFSTLPNDSAAMLQAFVDKWRVKPVVGSHS